MNLILDDLVDVDVSEDNLVKVEEAMNDDCIYVATKFSVKGETWTDSIT